MRRIRGLLLAYGVFAAISGVTNAQDTSGGNKGAFGPIVVPDAYGRPLAVYRKSYDGPFNRQLDKLGDKMREAGMQGGLPPLYLPASGSGFGYFGYGFNSGNSGFGSPLYHPVGASTEPSPYYDPVFNSLVGTPTPEAASRPYTFSPPWSKDYRQGQPRQHKLFSRHKG